MSDRSDRRREIERLLALRASKGLTLRALSERSGIPAGTLSWWSHRLRRESAVRAFAEVQIVDLPDVGAHERREAEVPDVVLRERDGLAVELYGRAGERVVEALVSRIRASC